MSNTRAATTAAAEPLEFQVMLGSFALVGNQPANYTLATGETEALLVDVPFSRSDAHRVVAAILDSGKKLTTIFVTHDHPDTRTLVAGDLLYNGAFVFLGEHLALQYAMGPLRRT